MSDHEPALEIEMGDETFTATRSNTILFRFFGSLALYDHVFLITDKEESRGCYLFRANPAFEKVAGYIIEHHYEAHVNLQRLPECDKQAYEEMILKEVHSDLGDGVPQDWTL